MGINIQTCQADVKLKLYGFRFSNKLRQTKKTAKENLTLGTLQERQVRYFLLQSCSNYSPLLQPIWFMTHHWKACEPNRLKMPACKLYLVPGPRKTAFLQPPLKWPADPEPFARLFGRHLEIFSQIVMKHLGGGLAPT